VSRCRIPAELLQRSTVSDGVIFFEVSLLRANNDPPGGRCTEYPDVRIGVQRAEGKEGTESAFGPASVTIRSSDGFVYCGYQPRDLCCGSLEQGYHFMEGDVIGVGLLPNLAMVCVFAHLRERLCLECACLHDHAAPVEPRMLVRNS
jgi:hypothetical protein